MPIDPNVLLKAQPADIGGAIQVGDQANMTHLKAAQTRSDYFDNQNDMAAIKDYSALPDTDLYTSKGLKEAQDHLKGRVSPKTMMELADRTNKAQQGELSYQSGLQKFSKAMLEAEHDDNEFTAKYLGPVVKEQDPEKRKVLFEETLKQIADAKRPDGKPRLTPQQLDSLSKSPPQAIDALYAGSDFKKQVTDTARKEAETKKQDAQTEALKSGGPVTHWTTPAGEDVVVDKHGKVNKVDTVTGDWTPMASLPTGSYQAGKKNPTTVPPDASKMLSDEDNAYLAEYEMTTGKPIPGIPVGTGSAAASARQAYLKAFVKVAKEKGYAADEAGQLALRRDATREAIKQRTTQNAAIEAGERDLKIVGGVIKDELSKIGGADSPLARKYWNKVSTEWAGDPQFAGLNAALVNYKETAARVYSGQSGAGGTPVTYLKLAESSIGGNPTLEQFSKTTDVMNKLFEARKQSNEGTIKGLLESVRMVDKPAASSAASPTNETVPATEQKARDTDAIQIMREELAKTREKYRAETDPTKKARLATDIKGIEREIKSKGGKLETAPSDSGIPPGWKVTVR